MGAQFDRLRYEVFQNLFLSPLDTVFLRTAVATVLTDYGIETYHRVTYLVRIIRCNSTYRLRYWNQQHQQANVILLQGCNSTYRLRYWNFIITSTAEAFLQSCNSTYRLRYWNRVVAPPSISLDLATLQQYLPFTVLKLINFHFIFLL